MVTGGSLPVHREEGARGDRRFDQPALAGSSSGPPPSGRTPPLSRIMKLVEGAQASKAPIQKLVEQGRSDLRPVVVVIAAITLVTGSPSDGDVEKAIVTAVTVLVIACPLRALPPNAYRDHGGNRCLQQAMAS